MAIVVQRKRILLERPLVQAPAGLSLRTYQGEEDISLWLTLRERAFARQQVGVGQWDIADFRREFLDKPWWRPNWMWFAECEDGQRQTVGTVTMALRQSRAATMPVVHWLCVLSRWRRRGAGQLLMSTLEAAAWDAGFREVALETHEAWREAAALYDALGYEVIGPAVANQ